MYSLMIQLCHMLHLIFLFIALIFTIIHVFVIFQCLAVNYSFIFLMFCFRAEAMSRLIDWLINRKLIWIIDQSLLNTVNICQHQSLKCDYCCYILLSLFHIAGNRISSWVWIADRTEKDTWICQHNDLTNESRKYSAD